MTEKKRVRVILLTTVILWAALQERWSLLAPILAVVLVIVLMEHHQRRKGTLMAGLPKGVATKRSGLMVTAWRQDRPLLVAEEDGYRTHLSIADVHRCGDEELTNAWLRHQCEVRSIDFELTVEGGDLRCARRKDVTSSMDFQHRMLDTLLDVALTLRSLETQEQLLRRVTQDGAPLARFLVAQRLGRFDMGLGVLRQATAPLEVRSAATRWLIAQLRDRPEDAEEHALRWLWAADLVVIAAGFRLAATQGEALRGTCEAAARRLLGQLMMSGLLQEERRYVLREALTALGAKAQPLILKMLALPGEKMRVLVLERLAEVGTVSAVEPLKDKKLMRTNKGRQQQRTTLRRIQARLHHAEVGSLTLTDMGGEVGELSLADHAEGAISHVTKQSS